MNWKAIKKDCPKGWDMAVTFDHSIPLNTRRLYDFLDEKEIYISVVYEDGGKPFWVSVDYVEDELCIGIEIDDYMHRPEAESAAFEKAFQILEERLNKEA